MASSPTNRATFSGPRPGEEVHAFVNELERPIGTYLYGRRMYEVMQAWETMDTSAESPAMNDYAQIWRAADKVVYSTTLAQGSSARDAYRAAVRCRSGTPDESVGNQRPQHRRTAPGPRAIAAGLVDEYQIFITPIVVGGGTAWLPAGLRFELGLLDERRFASGVVYLRYREGGKPTVA